MKGLITSLEICVRKFHCRRLLDIAFNSAEDSTKWYSGSESWRNITIKTSSSITIMSHSVLVLNISIIKTELH